MEQRSSPRHVILGLSIIYIQLGIWWVEIGVIIMFLQTFGETILLIKKIIE